MKKALCFAPLILILLISSAFATEDEIFLSMGNFTTSSVSGETPLKVDFSYVLELTAPEGVNYNLYHSQDYGIRDNATGERVGGHGHYQTTISSTTNITETESLIFENPGVFDVTIGFSVCDPTDETWEEIAEVSRTVQVVVNQSADYYPFGYLEISTLDTTGNGMNTSTSYLEGVTYVIDGQNYGLNEGSINLAVGAHRIELSSNEHYQLLSNPIIEIKKDTQTHYDSILILNELYELIQSAKKKPIALIRVM